MRPSRASAASRWRSGIAHLGQEEAERLLEAAQEVSSQRYGACATLLLTGLRVSDLTSVT